ncbi:hypothetical protein EG329_004481 [Mollisiaceae sp. DMI_Dod_QoI]|nr:hypothetical protein EG329_004481 [Helotiales sp. DMI_Dod_QoI]
MPVKSLSHVFLLIITMSTLALSQTSTISLFLPGGGPSNEGDLVGSIIASDDTATTYVIGCAADVTASICEDYPGVTLTEGSDMAAFTITPYADDTTTIDYAYTFSCTLDVSSASCTYDISTSGASISTSEIYFNNNYTSNIVLITPNTAAASTTAAASSTTREASTKGEASITSVTSGSSHASGVTASATSGSSSTKSGTSTSTGVGAATTVAPAWVFGGAAFAFAAMV